MKLADLRKLAIKKQQKIRFSLKNGMECVMDERGVALVPGLDRAPDFNLERELESAATFILEPLPGVSKNPPKPKTVGRDELASLLAAGPAASRHDEHEEE
jgi:hypothetical protein